jgi:hypothetical protein
MSDPSKGQVRGQVVLPQTRPVTYDFLVQTRIDDQILTKGVGLVAGSRRFDPSS